LDKTSAKGPAFDQPSRRGQENGEKLPEFSSTKCGWDTVWDVELTKMLIFHGILLIQLKKFDDIYWKSLGLSIMVICRG